MSSNYSTRHGVDNGHHIRNSSDLHASLLPCFGILLNFCRNYVARHNENPPAKRRASLLNGYFEFNASAAAARRRQIAEREILVVDSTAKGAGRSKAFDAPVDIVLALKLIKLKPVSGHDFNVRTHRDFSFARSDYRDFRNIQGAVPAVPDTKDEFSWSLGLALVQLKNRIVAIPTHPMVKPCHTRGVYTGPSSDQGRKQRQGLVDLILACPIPEFFKHRPNLHSLRSTCNDQAVWS